MKLTKRIKQLIFGLAWADVGITIGTFIINPKLGELLGFIHILVMCGIVVAILFWLTYQLLGD